MEWIANMEGPAFLGLYAAVILTVLGGAFFAVRSSAGADASDPLVPAAPNPYEMAYLRGGEREMAKLALIELARRGYIQQRMGSALRGGKAYLKRKTTHPSAAELPAPQRQIFELVEKEDKPVAKLIASRGFAKAVEGIKQEFLPRLEREGLLVSGWTRAKVLLAGALTVAGLGGYKLVVALEKGRYNVGFLILFAIVALIALYSIVNTRLTSRGKKYFLNTQEAYRGETSDVVLDVGAAKPHEMLLQVGLFGAPILFGASGEAYATMLGLDPKARYGATGCSMGCGSDSSGGDGGGDGGCGGGCGGCGGD